MIALFAGLGCDAQGTQAPSGVALPMQPVDDVVLSAIAPGVTSAASGLLIEASLALAIAPGYPDEVDVRFSSPYYTSCGLLAGAPAYETLESDSFEAELFSDGSGFALRASGEAEGDIVLRGRYQLSADEPCGMTLGAVSLPVEARIHVVARRPAGAVLIALDCLATEEQLYVATSSETSITVALRDANGEQMHAANASLERQVSLTLESDVELERPYDEQGDEQGLASFKYPAQPAHIRVVPAFGDPLTVEVVDARAATGLEVTFGLGGVAGGGLEVEDGMTYPGGWGRVSNRLAPTIDRVAIGEGSLCGAPDPAWFELSSDTPAQCEVRPGETGSVYGLVFPSFGHTVDRSARLLQDGTCALRLRMPDFNQGEGVEQSIAVTFENVEDMIEWPF